MTISEIIRQGLHYARACKSLWLFGFFVGLASGGSSTGGAGGDGGGVAVGIGGGAIGVGGPFDLSVTDTRLRHGLKLIVAAFGGTLIITFVGLVAIVPVTLLLVALIPVLRIVPVIVLGCLVLLPAIYVLTAMLGTLRSSIWTIGYLTQLES